VILWASALARGLKIATRDRARTRVRNLLSTASLAP
jgi:hypothetical protein